MCESTKGIVRVPAPTTVVNTLLVFCGSMLWSRRAGNEFHGADGRGVGDHRTCIEQVDNAAHARGLARVAGIFTAASSLSTGGKKNWLASTWHNWIRDSTGRIARLRQLPPISIRREKREPYLDMSLASEVEACASEIVE